MSQSEFLNTVSQVAHSYAIESLVKNLIEIRTNILTMKAILFACEISILEIVQCKDVVHISHHR
jgi:hypothetical protein